MAEQSALDRLLEKDVLKLTPLEWCIIALYKTGQGFESAFDAAAELEKLRKDSNERNSC